MMGNGSRRALLGVLCAALALAAGAPGAQAASSDPLFTFKASQNTQPGGEFEGPCGLAVDIAGNFYVSDYYHHAIYVYSAFTAYKTRITNVDPLDGPCGLALDATGRLYVNGYHRNVVRYTPTAYPPAGPSTGFILGPAIDSDDPTGVAVNLSTNTVYVNGRTHIAVYDSTGAPTGEIGLGSLGDGYGLAVSRFAGTLGRLYVPDAATNTVKVYDPLISTPTPVATVAGPPGGFGSLRDSAIAIDDVSGDIYVADQAGSRLGERPESTIQVFNFDGVHKGHLKYNVIDAAPVGLAVDNSTGPSQGRVYVTSGNASGAFIYAYPPGAATVATPLPATSAAAAESSSTQPVAAPVTAAAVAAPALGPAVEARVDSGRHPRAKRQHHRSKQRGHRGSGDRLRR